MVRANGKYCRPYDVPGPSGCLKTATKIRRSYLTGSNMRYEISRKHSCRICFESFSLQNIREIPSYSFFFGLNISKKERSYSVLVFFWLNIWNQRLRGLKVFPRGRLDNSIQSTSQTPKFRGTKNLTHETNQMGCSMYPLDTFSNTKRTSYSMLCTYCS